MDTGMLTVGVPVYNAERLLARCLENLCAEDLDYQIVVADNASTDNTARIAESFARNDSRVRYIRHPENIGAGGNFWYLLDNAATELFAWRAYDDLSSPGYFKALVAGMRDNPRCNLAVGSLKYEVEQGRTPEFQAVPRELPADLAHRRKVLLDIAEVTWFYGVFRRDVLRRRYLSARSAYHYVWSFDPLLILPYLLEGSVFTDPGVVFTQYVSGGSAAQYRPKGVLEPVRLMAQFCRHGFAIADELATSGSERLRLYTEVIRYANSYGMKFSRIIKRALFWPYYRITGKL